MKMRRIDVIVSDEEDEACRRAARHRGLILAEWVRQAVQAAIEAEAREQASEPRR